MLSVHFVEFGNCLGYISSICVISLLKKWDNITGAQEIQPLHTQINKRETGNNRTWSATSIVQIPATRERHGETIQCVALHESYAAKSLSVEAKLDVKCK